MKEIGNLSVGDKFTESRPVSISTSIYTVEQFITDDGIVIARDASGWGKAYNDHDVVFPWITLDMIKGR